MRKRYTKHSLKTLIFPYLLVMNNVGVTKQSFKQISDGITSPYHNSVIDTVNDHCLRLSVMTGEYRWHYHAHTDELFVTLEGSLLIEIKDQASVTLLPGEFIKIPKGTIHKTSTTSRSVNLSFERHADDTVFVDYDF